MTDIHAKFVTQALNLVICSNQPPGKARAVDFADDGVRSRFDAVLTVEH
jgi:hypothetical protein